MTQMSSIPQRHQRRLSTVHLAGLSIITGAHNTVCKTPQQQHNSNALIHVSLPPLVFLSAGFGLTSPRAAGCIPRIIHIITLAAKHCLKSSDSVTLRQVSDVSRCCFVAMLVHGLTTIDLQLSFIIPIPRTTSISDFTERPRCRVG